MKRTEFCGLVISRSVQIGTSTHRHRRRRRGAAAGSKACASRSPLATRSAVTGTGRGLHGRIRLPTEAGVCSRCRCTTELRPLASCRSFSITEALEARVGGEDLDRVLWSSSVALVLDGRRRDHGRSTADASSGRVRHCRSPTRWGRSPDNSPPRCRRGRRRDFLCAGGLFF